VNALLLYCRSDDDDDDDDSNATMCEPKEQRSLKAEGKFLLDVVVEITDDAARLKKYKSCGGDGRTVSYNVSHQTWIDRCTTLTASPIISKSIARSIYLAPHRSKARIEASDLEPTKHTVTNS
jgi:hypothetical protein